MSATKEKTGSAIAEPVCFCADSLSLLHLRHRFSTHRLEHQLIRLAVDVDLDVRAMQHFAVEDLDRQRVLDHALQSALERPRTIGRIGAGRENQLPRRLRSARSRWPGLQAACALRSGADRESCSTARCPAGGRSRCRPRGSGTPAGSARAERASRFRAPCRDRARS